MRWSGPVGVVGRVWPRHGQRGRPLAEQCGADLPLSAHMGPDPSGFDRICFAVLKLSGGDLERLRREIDGAHCDWRDTLMAAGFGRDIHAHLTWNP